MSDTREPPSEDLGKGHRQNSHVRAWGWDQGAERSGYGWGSGQEVIAEDLADSSLELWWWVWRSGVGLGNAVQEAPTGLGEEASKGRSSVRDKPSVFGVRNWWIVPIELGKSKEDQVQGENQEFCFGAH